MRRCCATRCSAIRTRRARRRSRARRSSPRRGRACCASSTPIPRTTPSCFTANASAAIGLVAEGVPFGPTRAVRARGRQPQLGEWHSRVRARVPAPPCTTCRSTTSCDSTEPRSVCTRCRARSGGLFAFPAQSNFSGRAASALARAARRSRAAIACCSTRRRTCPTSRAEPSRGAGGLRRALVLQDVRLSHRCRRARRAPTSAGRATAPVVRGRHGGLRVGARRARMRYATGVEGFEDGTANFLAIGAIPAGLDFLEQVGVERVERRATWLALRLIRELRADASRRTARRWPRCTGRRAASVAARRSRSTCSIPRASRCRISWSRSARARRGCRCVAAASATRARRRRHSSFLPSRADRCLSTTRATGWSIPRFAECMQGTRWVPFVRRSARRAMAMIWSGCCPSRRRLLTGHRRQDANGVYQRPWLPNELSLARSSIYVLSRNQSVVFRRDMHNFD